jgi:hypothetical protein
MSLRQHMTVTELRAQVAVLQQRLNDLDAQLAQAPVPNAGADGAHARRLDEEASMWLLYLRFDDGGLVKTYHVHTYNKNDVADPITRVEQYIRVADYILF